MVLEHEHQTTYSSVEEVIAEWKQRFGEDWVQDALALPNLDEKIANFARRSEMSLPDAWSSYFSGVMLTQI